MTCILENKDKAMNSGKIKIAMVLGVMGSGGVEAIVMNYLHHLSQNDFDVDIIFHEDSPFPQRGELEAMGVPFYPVPSYAKIGGYQKVLRKLFRQKKYDIVHAHINTMNGFPLLAAKKEGVPARICHNHSTAHRDEGFKTLAKYVLRPFARSQANHYFACGEAAGRWMYGDKAFESGLVTVLYNAIDFDHYRFNLQERTTLREERGIGQESLVVGNVGRFMFQKNHRFLVKVFARLHRVCPDSHLLLVGEGPLLEETEELVKRYELKDAVHFLGVRNDMSRVYSAIDVFCLPSHYEGMPVVVVEAFANGVPMLCSGFVSDEVERFGNTKRMDSGADAAAYAKELMEMAKEGVLQRANPPDADVRQQFDIQKQAEELALLYQEMRRKGETHR